MRSTGTMMHIGDLAERTGLSHRTIRHYDEIGLLRPSGRSDGGFRLYTDEDLERLMLIRRMKPLGFSLEEMTQLLEIIDGLEHVGTSEEREALHRRLADFIADGEQRRAHLVEQLRMADEFLGLLRQR